MAEPVDGLMKLADEAIHAYAAWLAEFIAGDLPSPHVDRLNTEKDAAREKLRAAIESTCGVDACGSSGTVDCQSTDASQRCAVCPHGVLGPEQSRKEGDDR